METGVKPLFLVLLLSLLVSLATSFHVPLLFFGQRCSSSSCGSITNISHPLRLKSEPKICGDPRYELSCENNSTVLYLGTVRHYVEAINYNNYTIRIVDADYQKDNCSSFPRYPSDWTSDYLNFPWRKNVSYMTFWDTVDIAVTVVFLKCKKRMNSSLYRETVASCRNTSDTYYYYIVDGELLQASDLSISCEIEQRALLSPNVLTNKNALDIRTQLSLGF